MDSSHIVLPRLYEHIEPIDRGSRYEDPLQAALEGKGIGEVTGGGSQLDEDVYAELDFEGVVAEIGAAAGEDSYDGFWQGAEETGLYFFGPDAEAMFARVEPVLRRLPIGQNARVVLRSGRDGLNPREVRMPRH